MDWRRLTARGVFSGVVLVSLVVGSLFGFGKAGSRAYAQEPAFILYGSVASELPLPSRVRATIGDVTCGSAEVSQAGPDTGFYALVIVSADSKPGCGVDGAAVQLSLVRGEIDPGAVAAQVLFRAGAVVRLDLSSVPLVAGSFVGALPAGEGQAFVRWTGPSGTPVEQAVATLGREVVVVSFWDVSRQAFREYVVGAPEAVQTYTLVDTDDIVLVHVR